MPEDCSIRNTFDRLAREYDDLKLRIIPAYRQIQRMTLRYAAASGGERVLELGCGTGEWASLFLERYRAIEYLAIEFSEKMRELASQRCAKQGAGFTC
jgi:ubiquinone/menaquinone biosynthesis C-methylase UbiE